MYSPKIEEELIPVLYRIGKAQKKPMTKVVADLIRKGMVAENAPQIVIGVADAAPDCAPAMVAEQSSAA